LIFANQQPPLQPDVFTGTTVTLSFGHRSPHFEQTARSMKAWTRQFSPSRAASAGTLTGARCWQASQFTVSSWL
jgi:hypothetical protein